MAVEGERPMRARIPADVDQPDRIAFGLTARQLLILTVVGLVLYGIWQALLPVTGPLVLLVVTIPVAAGAVALALARREGVGLGVWLAAALRHRRSDKRMVPTHGERLQPAPGWVATTGARDRLVLPAPLRLPVRGVDPDGVVDLGPDGRSALVECQTVNFGLRSPAEQNGLVAGFGRWLNSLDVPVQVLMRAHRLDLADHADRVRSGAAELSDPALEQAATDHAEFLDELAAGRELLHRQVTVAVRDRRSGARAAGRAGDTAQVLAACEVKARALSGPEATAVLAAALDPNHPHVTDTEGTSQR